MEAIAVCYAQDGWHHAVTIGEDGNEVVGERLFLDDDGTYRPAVEGDASWHDRKHRSYALVVPESGSAAVAVTADEMEAIDALLAERRGQ